MIKLLSIGSAVVDIYLSSNEFEMPSDNRICISVSGGKIDIQNFEIQTGGGATNTAASFSKLGFEVAIISELGKDLLTELIHHAFCHQLFQT